MGRPSALSGPLPADSGTTDGPPSVTDRHRPPDGDGTLTGLP